MKHEITYYECDYCNKNLTESGLVNSDGYGGIYDEYYTNYATIDICDKPNCYNKHLESVRYKMNTDDGLLFLPMDMANIEYNTNSIKDIYKIKWSNDDKWHRYKRKTLIDLLIPYYEKYCITGNKHYIK